MVRTSWRWRALPVRGSPRAAGRIAGILYLGAGLLSLASLALPGPPDMDRTLVGVSAIATLAVGTFAWFAPWDRWPRWTTLALVPVAFALISLSNTFSGYQPYGYGVYYVVVFVWLGITYPPWTSLWCAPLAAASYVLPLSVLPGDFGTAAGSAVIVVPSCVLVGEVLAWGRGRLLRTEQELVDSTARARGLADAAFDAIVLHDGERIREANRAFVTMFGYASDEVIGLRLAAIGLANPTADRPATVGGDPMRPDEEIPRAPEQRVLSRRDGSTFTAEVGSRSLPDRGGMVRLTAVRDVTAYREAAEREHAAAERLRALDDMKNTFLNAVSHELRTPLAAVLGSALTLERLGLRLDEEDQQALLHAVSENARKLERMLADLLDLDRLTRGVLELRRQPTDLASLIEQAAEGVGVGSHPLHVRVEPVTFAVDAPKVERIVENLVANAAKHTPEGSPIWVRGGVAAGGVSIVVEDAGPGVPAELRGAIFEPFRQAQPILDGSPGVGIGLSLVARFAQLHGGRAWVEERAGGGSAFHVLLGPEERGEATAQIA